MGGKALIIRYGAYGDIVHMSHLPRLLKDQGFERVEIETNFKGFQLLGNNPFIDRFYFHEPVNHCPESLMQKHWDSISEGYDKVINLYRSLEYGVIAMEGDNEYFMHQQVRRNRWSHINYYDQTTAWAGYPNLQGCYLGELFYPENEVEIAKNYIKKFEGKFKVLINVCGTGKHKRFIQAQEVASKILERYQDAVVFVTGAKEYSVFNLEGDRIVSFIDKKFPFRQVALLSKYMDCVVSLESGIACVANMWGTPTVQLMTAASLMSHVKYAKNDFSLQSPVRCSPCHKGPYKYMGCPMNWKDKLPMCVYFDVEKVLENIHKCREIFTGERNDERIPSRNPRLVSKA